MGLTPPLPVNLMTWTIKMKNRKGFHMFWYFSPKNSFIFPHMRDKKYIMTSKGQKMISKRELLWFFKKICTPEKKKLNKSFFFPILFYLEIKRFRLLDPCSIYKFFILFRSRMELQSIEERSFQINTSALAEPDTDGGSCSC